MASTDHHSGKMTQYRDRATDAAAIGNFLTGAKTAASSVVSDITESATTAIASAVNPILAEGRAMLDSVVSSVQQVAPTAIATATAALAKLQFSGMTGNFQSATENIVLTLTAFNVADDNSVNIGAPYRKIAPLWMLGGFCQCENAKVLLDCTETEQKAVEDLLNKGVFLE